MKPSSRILKTEGQQQKAVSSLSKKGLPEKGPAKNGLDGLRKKGSNVIKGAGKFILPKCKVTPPQKEPEKKMPYKGKNRRAQGLGGELAEIERSAYERGFTAGEDAGRVLGMKKSEQCRQTLAVMIDEMGTLQSELIREAEEDMLAISLAVIQRILGQGVAVHREAILEQIKKAVKKVGRSEKTIVRLNPLDLDAISEESDTLSRLLKAGGTLKFEADTGLSSGECIVEGPTHMVDGRFENQIALFTASLKETLN